jgi:hypothetical protein
MIFSTAVSRLSDTADIAVDDDDCSMGSLTPVAHGVLKNSESNITNDSGEDSYESTMSILNKKIHTLFLDWERRRETAKERNNLEKKQHKGKNGDVTAGSSSSSSSHKATPSVSAFVTHVKNSCYKRKNPLPSSKESDVADKGYPKESSSSFSSPSSSYLPYPSQMRTLAPLSSTRLDDYISSRAKTRLTRKSERVLIIDRMKGTEKAFHSRRLTCDQMKTLLAAIEGPDERQHAALLLIVRLTDVVEIEANDEILKTIELSAECDKRIKLVASILAAEARAEDHLRDIHNLYTTCFSTGQKVKDVISASKKDEDADYLRFKSIQKLQDAPLVSPKLQSEMRSKIKDFKSDISVMRKAVSQVHTALTTGFTLHLCQVQAEQDCIAKLTAELKLVVMQCESVCRMRGTLTAGRPEYLVFHRLKVDNNLGIALSLSLFACHLKTVWCYRVTGRVGVCRQGQNHIRGGHR